MKKHIKFTLFFLLLALGLFCQKGFGQSHTTVETAIKTGSWPHTSGPHWTEEDYVSIRICSGFKGTTCLFAPTQSIYSLLGDGKEIIRIDNKGIIHISLEKDSVLIKSFETILGKYAHVQIKALDQINGFKLRWINPEKKPRLFDGNIDVYAENGSLKIINHMLIDHYIAGVTEAESGYKATKEYYKAQAILVRTFALGHLHKHAAEGFQLCDQVHCQVFFGKSKTAAIIEAAAETKNMVVVDEDLQLIQAVFHSNSGGETANSEDVWGSKTSYLKAVNDSFSTAMPNARWTKRIKKESFLYYLKSRYHYPTQDSNAVNYAMHFTQYSRKIHLEYNGIKVPTKNIRNDFQLKSAYFSIVPSGDTLIFQGRGFGHGIGLCQEGAMRMTELGYSYLDVLKFYYRNIHILNIREMHFFREG